MPGRLNSRLARGAAARWRRNDRYGAVKPSLFSAQFDPFLSALDAFNLKSQNEHFGFPECGELEKNVAATHGRCKTSSHRTGLNTVPSHLLHTAEMTSCN
jgi:hypothetical protein